MRDCLKIVVTGEVDTGKSTLIGRFLYELDSFPEGIIDEVKGATQKLGGGFELAYLLDSFEEERKNKLTIDTTQVYCKTKKGREFIFIDVPGHQELIKNMLCGSSYADSAILVVDVGKSIEEQTKRHALILKFLGVEQIILVLNKMDLVDFNNDVFNNTKEGLLEFFKKIGIKPKNFIPISASQGDNICSRSRKLTWYNGPLLTEALNACFKTKRNDAFCFPIQDVYDLEGRKVAVGGITSGTIKKGDRIKILPLNKEGKIKTIKVFKQDKISAKVPESIGLVLSDGMDELGRGQIICKGKLPEITNEILVKILCVCPINIKKQLRYKSATQQTYAQIKQINGVWDTASSEAKFSKVEILEETDIAEIIITTENPVVTEKYEASNNLGRFVLQDNNSEIYALGAIL